MKRYSVTYKERYVKTTKVYGTILEATKMLTVKDVFQEQIQEYSIFGEPKYCIINIKLLRDNEGRI